jgi:hypothetical protein
MVPCMIGVKRWRAGVVDQDRRTMKIILLLICLLMAGGMAEAGTSATVTVHACICPANIENNTTECLNWCEGNVTWPISSS